MNNSNNLLHLLRPHLKPTNPSPSYFSSSIIIPPTLKPLPTHTTTKALRVLSLISPNPPPQTSTETRHAHLRLIDDFLQTHPVQPLVPHPPTSHPKFASPGPHFVPLRPASNDPIPLLLRLHREGLMKLGDVGLFVVSRSLGACGGNRDFGFGGQLHCLVVKCGFLKNLYVGSSLVSLYGKCGELRFARNVFDEMPERNVVSWSALISGFAQDWRVDVCVELYVEMRRFGFQPNDYTLSALLSACMGSGSRGIGRIVHCQVILLGFSSDVTVSNAVVSMYCKCGDIEDALCVFEAMDNKDTVSWNSIIAGYSLHGLGIQATELFEEMRTRDVKPDAITFLNVLSSCRHGGLVDHGRHYFNVMGECGVEPDLDHYSCLVDLLGRAGLLEEARDLVLEMPMQPNAVVWGTLLSCCRFHDNVWIGIEAAKNRLALEPGCSATHVQLANMYARLGRWDESARVRKVMKDRVLKTSPGFSWIEIGSDVFRFKVDDTSNVKMSEALYVLEILKEHLAVSDDVGEPSDEILDNL